MYVEKDMRYGGKVYISARDRSIRSDTRKHASPWRYVDKVHCTMVTNRK